MSPKIGETKTVVVDGVMCQVVVTGVATAEVEPTCHMAIADPEDGEALWLREKPRDGTIRGFTRWGEERQISAQSDWTMIHGYTPTLRQQPPTVGYHPQYGNQPIHVA